MYKRQPLYVGIGVIAAGLIAVIVIKGMGSAGVKDTLSNQTKAPVSVDSAKSTVPSPQAGSAAPVAQTKTPGATNPGGGKTTAPTIDAQLYTISNRLDEGATAVTYNEVLQEIGALKPKIKLLDDSVNADYVRARAKFGLGDKDGACAIIAAAEPRARREKDKLGIASVKSDAGCPPSE